MANIFRKEDLLAIEQTLYEVKEDELVARSIAHVNTNYPSFASEIGYDWFKRTGSAKILGRGGSASDIPFVGEEGGRETAKVFTIATGIRYEKAEREAAAAQAALGKGPAVTLDQRRVASARRYIAETENRLFFVGDKDCNIKGILNKAGILTENVAKRTSGTLWSEKTSQDILADLLAGKEAIEKDGIFKARVLILPPAQYLKLSKPYSDMSPQTIRSWLESEGMFFEKIISTRAMKKTINGMTVDAFCILDNDPEIMELVVTEDLTLGNPVFDILETSEQAVTERTPGAIIRHPSAIYIGKGL